MIEEIENAIAAHMKWLKNIKTVVLVATTMDTKSSGNTNNTNLITKIESDHQCVFGKWLYDTSEGKKSIYYDQTVILHAQFHKQAAHILSLAFDGKKSQARSLTTADSDFIKCSEKLMDILEEWKDNA